MILNPRLAGILSHLEGGSTHGRVATSGLMAVAAALGMCADVTVYGISNLSDAFMDRSACAYYYDACAVRLGQYLREGRKAHDFDHQSRIIRALAAHRHIRLA